MGKFDLTGRLEDCLIHSLHDYMDEIDNIIFSALEEGASIHQMKTAMLEWADSVDSAITDAELADKLYLAQRREALELINSDDKFGTES